MAIFLYNPTVLKASILQFKNRGAISIIILYTILRDRRTNCSTLKQLIPYNLYIYNIYNKPKLPMFSGLGTKIDTEDTKLLEIADRYKIELATEEGIVTIILTIS
ncbi:hypothetical protein TMatcc_005089 [Talaromyces marneffei ATCC 18224]